MLYSFLTSLAAPTLSEDEITILAFSTPMVFLSYIKLLLSFNMGETVIKYCNVLTDAYKADSSWGADHDDLFSKWDMVCEAVKFLNGKTLTMSGDSAWYDRWYTDHVQADHKEAE